jgi:hypothetical protein
MHVILACSQLMHALSIYHCQSNLIMAFRKRWNDYCSSAVVCKLFYLSVLKGSPELFSSLVVCCPLSVNFYILDFSSETTVPILTKVGMNHPRGVCFQNIIRWSCQPSNMAAVTINRTYEVKLAYRANKAAFSTKWA